MKNKYIYKVTLMQSNVEATFHLNEKEMQALQKSASVLDKGRVYETAMFVWANYDLSRSKCNRFHSVFNYNKGDFFFFVET